MTSHHVLLRRAFSCCFALLLVTLLYLYSTENGHSRNQRFSIRPASAHRLYPSNWTLVNLKRFEFLLNSGVCSDDATVQLIVVVTSHPGHVELRRAFRAALPARVLKTHGIRRVFLMARINPAQLGYDQVDQSAIEAEHLAFGDVVQGDFQEDYRNLTYKHVMGLKYAVRFCPQAQLVLKMDDDIAVDIFRLWQSAKEQLLGNATAIVGAVMTGHEREPVRDRASKWYVSKEDYPMTRYPPFLSGWAYLATMEAARRLVTHSESSPFFWIDDIYVTGLLADLSGIGRVDLRPRYTVYTDHLLCCLRNGTKACDYFAGPLDDPDDLELFYRHTLDCHLGLCPPDGQPASRCVITAKPFRLAKGRVVHGQIIPLT